MAEGVDNWDEISSWWRREAITDLVYREDIEPMLQRLVPGDPGVLSAPARLRIQMKPAHTRMGIQFDVPLKIEMEDSQRTKWGLD